MNPPAPRCMGMKARVVLVALQAPMMRLIEAGSMTSIMASSLSGWRNMSSVLPRRLRK